MNFFHMQIRCCFLPVRLLGQLRFHLWQFCVFTAKGSYASWSTFLWNNLEEPNAENNERTSKSKCSYQGRLPQSAMFNHLPPLVSQFLFFGRMSETTCHDFFRFWFSQFSHCPNSIQIRNGVWVTYLIRER